MANNNPINKTSEMRRVFFALIIMGGVALAASLLLDFSLCLFYHTTGLPCPSCGMTRAFIRLLTGDVGGAFQYHPLFFTVPLIPLLMSKKLPKKPRTLAITFLILLYLAVWIVRLILFFPHTSPMYFNENSLFMFLWRITAIFS